jgi:hypothetical protein
VGIILRKQSTSLVIKNETSLVTQYFTVALKRKGNILAIYSRKKLLAEGREKISGTFFCVLSIYYILS